MFEPEMTDFYFTDPADTAAWIYYLANTDDVQERIGAFNFMARHFAAKHEGKPLAPAEIAPRGGQVRGLDF